MKVTTTLVEHHYSKKCHCFSSVHNIATSFTQPSMKESSPTSTGTHWPLDLQAWYLPHCGLTQRLTPKRKTSPAPGEPRGQCSFPRMTRSWMGRDLPCQHHHTSSKEDSAGQLIQQSRTGWTPWMSILHDLNEWLSQEGAREIGGTQDLEKSV